VILRNTGGTAIAGWMLRDLAVPSPGGRARLPVTDDDWNKAATGHRADSSLAVRRSGAEPRCSENPHEKLIFETAEPSL